MIHLASLGGVHYFISFIDDFSHFTWLYFLKQKSKALQAFKNFCAKLELQFIPFKLLALCSDCGGKYVSRDFLTFSTKVGITHELIQAYTPSHNEVSKCKNCTFFEKVHLMVVDA
jgi:histone deacetylase 1/2